MGKTMTKKGAVQVTSALDNLAQLFEDQHDAMGIPARVAKEFALRCDMLSDFIEKKAGLKKALTGDDPVKEPGFNPEEVGEEVGGPLEGDGDEAYMDDEFTQQENRELRERVEDGDLGMTPVEDEQKPQPGKQANFTLAAAVDALNRGITAAVGKMSDAEASGYVKQLTSAEQQLTELQMEIAKVAGELLKRQEELEASHKKMLKEFGDKLPETLKGQSKAIVELKDCLISYTKVAGSNPPTVGLVKGKTLEQVEIKFSAEVRQAVADIMDAVIKENTSIKAAALQGLSFSLKTGAEHEAGVMDFLTAVGNFFSKMFKPLIALVGKATSVIKSAVGKATDSFADYEKAVKAVGKTAAEDETEDQVDAEDEEVKKEASFDSKIDLFA